MIKKTLYFGNPAYLSLRNNQLVIKLPEVEKSDSLPDIFKEQSEVTKPIEDIGVVVLAYIIHSGFISGYQNRYGDNLKPPTNVYHRMTA